jgi:hypothetical protein
MGIEEHLLLYSCTAGGTYSGPQMCDRRMQWLPKYNLSQGMGKIYMDIYLEKTSLRLSFRWHIQTVANC